MKTKIVDIKQMDQGAKEAIQEAADVLKQGGLVAFPTETVYGLGADGLNPEAVASIYGAKGRPSDNPLIVHVADLDSCRQLVLRLTEPFQTLTQRFWPGPLTLVLPKNPIVPDVTTGGLDTVAIRMPDHPVALELIRRAGCPIAAPSANLSGRPSPTKGAHVVQDLSGRVDVILTGDDSRIGIESTVLDLSGDRPCILRPGLITREELEETLGVAVDLDPGILGKEATIAKAPGMKYTHYAPKAEMIILRGPADRVDAELKGMKEKAEANGRRVGLVQFPEPDPRHAARHLFAKLREMDDTGVDLILASALTEENSVGFAVMNRMLKSAGYHVIDV